jgi:hypothetical protein
MWINNEIESLATLVDIEFFAKEEFRKNLLKQAVSCTFVHLSKQGPSVRRAH